MYDDFQHLTEVTYDSGGDEAPLPRPSTALGALPSSKTALRAKFQKFDWDWLGNRTSVEDNAGAYFDRSLGTLVREVGAPHRLKEAKGLGWKRSRHP